MNLERPVQIGPYKITREIGRGGMGVVYLARDTKLDRDVAIKALPPDVVDDEEKLSRFEREAKLLASLNHPNIATIYGLEEVDGRRYLILEYIDGDSLIEFLNRNRHSWRKCVEAAASIADALAAAHARGVVHRDIKPDNILFTRDGVVKVLDFGLSMEVSIEQADQASDVTIKLETKPGAVMGTPGYMSPEQVRGETADTRSDIFSFGCLLHEMLTNKPTFTRDTNADSMAATLRDEPDVPSVCGAHTPSELDPVLMRCLEKRPDDRFQSARDLAFSLRSVLSPTGTHQPITSQLSRAFPWRLVSVIAAVLAIAAVNFWVFRPKEPAPIAPTIQSLAVLPFVNESGDPELDFVCEGLAESVINRMSSVDALRVIPRNTAFRFQGSEADVDQLEAELDVQAILTGRILRRGDRLTISVTLEDVRRREQLWGERFDERLENILQIETVIAGQIATALRLELTSEQRKQLAKGDTSNSIAHLAYLEGRFWWHKQTPDSDRQALEFFNQAIKADPDSAKAYVGVADVYLGMVNWGVIRPSEARPRVEAAVQRALELNDSLAEAYSARAELERTFTWNWTAAERYYLRAIELNPDYAFAQHSYAHLLALLGRDDEATAKFEQAARLEPLSPHHNQCLGSHYVLVERYDDAVRVLEQSLRWDPSFAPAKLFLAWAHERQGNLDKAIEHLESGVLLNDRNLSFVAYLAYCAAVSGDRERAHILLDELLERRATEAVASLYIGLVHVGLGDMDEAMDWLETALETRDSTWLPAVQIDPGFDRLRGHPRFTALIKRLGLKPREPIRSASGPGSGLPRLAVLPFEITGTVADAEYLADEIPASVIDSLSTLSSIHVVPRSTAFRYRGSEADIAALGRQLNTDFILIGSIQGRGEDLRIRAELIEVATNSQRWSQRYDQSLADTLAVEEEITTRITQALQLHITGEEQTRLAKRRPVSAEAHAACLEGRFWWNKRTPDGLQKAIDLYQEATRLDPEYAVAHTEIGKAYLIMAGYSHRPNEVMPLAFAALKRAIEIDPELPEPHAALGISKGLYEWDWAAAEVSFEHALQLDPDNALVHHWYSQFLLTQARWDESQAHIDRAVALEPGSSIIRHDAVDPALLQRDYPRAAQLYERAIEMDPTFLLTLGHLGSANFNRGLPDEAIEQLRQCVTAEGAASYQLGWLGHYLGRAGRRAEALEELRRVEELSRHRYVPAYALAHIYAGLGDADRMFELFDRAIDERYFQLAWLRVEGDFEPYRNDPRFAELLRRIGLPLDPPDLPQLNIEIPRPSMAVLPFEMTGVDADAAYLADEIPASVIDSLSNISFIHVVPRSSSFRHRDSRDTIPDIGKALNADFVLTGQIVPYRGELRIRAELVSVRTGRQLFSESVERSADDTLLVESELTDSIIDTLKLPVSTDETQRLAMRRPVNAEAHAAYLEGRFWWNRRTPEGLARGLELFEKATAIDPSYALAYTGQAEALVMMSVYSRPLHEVMPQALIAANKALELNPNLAPAHTAMGWYAIGYEWDWAQAEDSFKRAIQLDPNYATAHHWYGIFLTYVGRWDEAREHLRRAIVLEPGSMVIRREQAFPHTHERNFADAVRLYREALAIDPGSVSTRGFLGEALRAAGRLDEAIEELKLASLTEAAGAFYLGSLGFTYGQAGRRDEALAELNRVTELSKTRYVPHSALALIHIGLGDSDRAFVLLERAVEEREFNVLGLKFDPKFDAFRGDPRFDVLLKRVGLPAAPPAPKVDSIEIPKPVIGVLPFEMTRENEDAAYLADEIPASIIDSLSNIAFVHIIPRSSSFRHRDSTKTIPEIGNALKADFVLTGQIVPRGNDLRIRAELVAVDTNRRVWSDKIDRSLNDTLAVETDITQQIVEALVIPVTPDESLQLQKRRPVSAQAHAAYLKGRFWWNKRTADGFAKAIEQFELAIAVDSDYALAHLGLADTYNLMGIYTHDPRDVLPKAGTAIDRALEINPNLAEAYASRGWFNLTWNLDWVAAERDFKECIRRNPRYAIVRLWYAWMLFAQGRMDQSLAESEKAHRLNPGSPIIGTDASSVKLMAGKLELARASLEETLKMTPNFSKALVILSRLDSLEGRYDEAIGRLQMMKTQGLIYPDAYADLGIYLAQVGRIDEAQKELDKLLMLRESEYVPAYALAFLYDALGETDQAMNWLETAFEERAAAMFAVISYREWRSLRSDPRFRDLAKRIGVDPDWIPPGIRRERNEP